MKLFLILNFLILSLNGKEIKKKLDERVVGGRPVNLGEIPYFAFLQMIEGATGESSQCGGSLIRYNWILTLAQCLSPSYSEIYVELGKVNRNIAAIWDSRINDQNEIFRHPNYDQNLHLNNIGLLHLKDATPSLFLHEFIDKINLPTFDDQNLNLIAFKSFVSGFGSTGGLTMSNFLNVVEMNVTENQICKEFFPGWIRDENLCTKTSEERSPCFGDEGGPLTATLPLNRHTLIGIVGLTDIFCTLGTPGVFSRVSTHLDWIYSIIENEITTTDFTTTLLPTTESSTTLIDTTTQEITTMGGDFTTTTELTTTVESTTTQGITTTDEPTTTSATESTTSEDFTTTTFHNTESTTTEKSTTEKSTTEKSTTESTTTEKSTTESTTTESTTTDTTLPTTEKVPLSAPKSIKLDLILSVLLVFVVNFLN